MEHVSAIINSLAWPVAALGLAWMFFQNLENIGRAFRKAPIIRSLKLSNIEVEFSKESTSELKEETEKAFATLIAKTDDELQNFSRTIGLEEFIARFSLDLWPIIKPSSRQEYEKSKPRVTVYIHDPIFTDQLYQIAPYFNPKNGRPFLLEGKGPGRRFSVRFGIIGLATRARSPEIIGDAFMGKEEDQRTLVREWSMTQDQAEAAKNKPSCLAIPMFDPESKAHIGLVYADAEIDDFFCDGSDKDRFLNDLTNLETFQKLQQTLADMHKLARQVDVRFDLTKIRPAK